MYHDKNSDSKNKTGKNLLIRVLVLVVMAAIAVGDVGEEPIEADVTESIESVEVGISSGEEAVFENDVFKKLSFNKDATIKTALRVLGAKYQKNIVPSLGVDGVLGFTTLYNVTFEEAMGAILGGKFEYEQKGNLIEVYTKGDISRMKHAVFALQYITAAEAQKLIAPVLSSKGQVGVTTAAQTGVPTGESISAATGGGDTMSLQDTIVVYDYAENIKRAKELITAIDVRPKQVLIEATILSATLTEDMQFGVDWQTLQDTAVTSLTGISSGSPAYFKSNGTQLGGATAVSGGLTVGFALGEVGSFIRAVEQVADVTILANPKILAVNKQLGQVYIGDKIGYSSQTTVSEGGTATTQVSFLDTGTKLSFRPYIGTDGHIRLDIHAKNSKETTGDVISETSTELVSNIMVKDGQTIVIGGLFQDTIETRKSQIPILGDLPIVGGAFKGTADQYVRKEVIVLLTPHIIEEPSETEGQARVDDIHRKRFGAKEELQWIGRARLAEDRYADAARYYIEGDNESALREVKTALALRPTYLEAIRLKERIIAEVDPDEAEKMERVMLEDIEREDTEKWRRR
jgi:type II secretory pathway component GspD/PulD (secretin)